MTIDRTTHTIEELMDLLDDVFAGERDRSGAGAVTWWDRFYGDPDRTAPFLTEAPDESLAGWLEAGVLPARGRALDLGCGPGRNAVHLARHGLVVDAVDLSPVAVDRTAQLAEQAGVDVTARVLDVFRGPLPSASYDLIHDSGLFHHLPPHRRISYLQLLDRALAPGGWFSLACFKAGPVEESPDDAELYRSGDLGGGLSYPDDALRAISGGLEEIELRPMCDEPPGSARFGVPFLTVALFRRPTG